jgi:flagellar basal body rod protein FlgC
MWCLQANPKVLPLVQSFRLKWQVELTGYRYRRSSKIPVGGDKRYIPGHPDADAEGYVTFPRVDPSADMVDLLGASRGFEANIAAMTAIKDMINHSIDLLK